MKKVLIVSPHFPPINAPDMQRVRLALPYLRSQGWEPAVLAVTPESVEGGVREPLLEHTYPSDVRVIRVNGISARTTRWAGVGNLWWRCGSALRKAGEELLRREHFDLVFFSTTQFGAFALGPEWKARFGVPYVLDYQDPWVNDFYARSGTRPPGGRVKFALSQWRARRTEPGVLRGAAGVVAVSDAYPAMLRRMYPWFDDARVRVLPFGASEADFAVAARHTPVTPLVNFSDGRLHHVYAGRAGADMATALQILFRGFARFRGEHPDEAGKMRFHFIGTGYAPPPLGADTVIPHAVAEGVADVVQEHRYRVPYFDALWYLRNAPALVAVGSNDATYSASKIFPYIAAHRPLLLVYQRESLVLKIAQALNVGTRVAFNAGDIDHAAEVVRREWFEAGAYARSAAFDSSAFAPYSAAEMTAQLVQVFEAAVKSGRPER
jgi:hypothetical protein